MGAASANVGTFSNIARVGVAVNGGRVDIGLGVALLFCPTSPTLSENNIETNIANVAQTHKVRILNPISAYFA